MKHRELCEKCGQPYGIGQWPWCDHGSFHQRSGFEPYTDVQLLPPTDPRIDSVNDEGLRGVWIDTPGKRRALMREQGLQFGADRERGAKREI
jgi:hypothetical protein